MEFRMLRMNANICCAELRLLRIHAKGGKDIKKSGGGLNFKGWWQSFGAARFPAAPAPAPTLQK